MGFTELDYLTHGDFKQVAELCHDKHITLRPGFPSSEARWDDELLQGFTTPGPAGGGCDLVNRVVWVGGLAPHEVLHEVLHVILAVPFIPIDHQPDEYMLLIPVERAYGWVLLNHQWFRECVEWQEMTTVQPPGFDMAELGYISDYENSETWLRGLSIGVRLGVLDEAFKPTFKDPDWNNITLEDRAYLSEGYRVHVASQHHL